MSDMTSGSPRIDTSKRTWLIASSCAGVAGGVATAIPFVSTFQPSEKAKAAGAAVEVDIAGLKVGEKITVEWRGKPVWILKRSPEQVAELAKLDGQLADPLSKRHPDEFTPEYAQNQHRSIKPDVLVVVPEVVVVVGPGPQPLTQNTLCLTSAPWEPSAWMVSLTWTPWFGWGSIPVRSRV